MTRQAEEAALRSDSPDQLPQTAQAQPAAGTPETASTRDPMPPPGALPASKIDTGLKLPPLPFAKPPQPSAPVPGTAAAATVTSG